MQVGRAALVSGVSRLVEVQRAVQNNGNVKSEPKYLAVKNLQYVLSTTLSELELGYLEKKLMQSTGLKTRMT